MQHDRQSYGYEAEACTGKQRFESYQGDTARKQARRMSQRTREPLTAYRCAWCDGWHIGHRLKAPKAIALRAQRASGPASSDSRTGDDHEQPQHQTA